MRQLITRIDERLHRKLKQRAAAEGRSVNALVTELLERAVQSADPRARVESRMRALGLLVTFPAPRHRPTYEELVAATRGAGTAVSDALAAERARR